jgi:sulfide:quinone oxidoreductase
MPMRVLVLGAGFGGLELATTLSEEAADEVEVTLVDKGDSFVFGYSKLDVLFGRTSAEAVRLPYTAIAKPGVRFLREEIQAIDPEARSVTTDAGTHVGDVLVVALGADYDYAATPGLTVDEEFYSVAGAELMARRIPEFTEGRAVVGVCGAPFKCPPAPSECALLLHDHLTERGVRDRCEIDLVIPFSRPIPPSPDSSEALLAAFEERGIRFVSERRVAALEPGAAVLDDDTRLAYDLFLGVPKHRAPDVVLASPLAENGYVPVDSGTLATRFPGVFAVGDCATVGVPKAGVFSERQAGVVARQIVARARGGPAPEPYDGRGSCYIEFGAGRVGRVDIDFFSGPKPTGTLAEPSAELVAEKEHFGSSRKARWFS